MQHVSVPLRAVVRAIYEAVYPSEDWAPVGFDEAERHGTAHHRQAAEAAQRARLPLSSACVEQLALI